MPIRNTTLAGNSSYESLKTMKRFSGFTFGNKPPDFIITKDREEMVVTYNLLKSLNKLDLFK